MRAVNLIKVALIWLADTINWIWNPFKQRLFAGHLDANLEPLYFNHLQGFVHEGRFSYQDPMPEDSGDEALFQGLYVGMLALKGSPLLDEAVEQLGNLFVDGRLLRGHRKDGSINDTASNDQATGMLFGLYCLSLKSHPAAKELITTWANRIVKDNYALCDLDGRPTKYGALEQGIKTDPLRMTLLLAILALAEKYQLKFKWHYDELYRKYRPLLKYPKVKLLWWDTDYDTHRAAIHLHVLYKGTFNPIYRKGMERLVRITRKENNAWANILCSVATPGNVNWSILTTFDQTRLEGVKERGVPANTELVKWGNETRSRSTLPIYARGSQEFFWQRNMFSVMEWHGTTVPYIFHTGLDWLLAYWLGKHEGVF